MSLFWPAKRKADTNVIARLGRVGHWLGILIAALTAIAAVVSLTTSTAQDGVVLVILAAFGSIAYFVGRAFRYILSNE